MRQLIKKIKSIFIYCCCCCSNDIDVFDIDVFGIDVKEGEELLLSEYVKHSVEVRNIIKQWDPPLR